MGKEKILEKFLQEMEISNKSHHTIVNYRSDINFFLKNCPESIENLTVDALRNHLGGLNSKSPTTKARHISSLKTFLNWCYRKDYIQANPIYKIDDKRPKIIYTPKCADKHCVENIIFSINIYNKNGSINVSNIKYKLLFTLMLETGMKISEALNIKFEDIEQETETILVNTGYKRRITLYSSNFTSILSLFTNYTSINKGYIFKGGESENKTLSYQAVNHFWRKCCKQQNTDYTLSDLRDIYAKELVKKGFDIQIISKMLGHRNIQATVKYLK